MSNDAVREQIAMQIHEISMDADPVKACIGRFMKATNSSVMQFIEDEFNRDTEGHDILYAMSYGISTYFAGAVNSVANPDQFEDVARALVQMQYDGILQQLEKYHKVQGK